MKVVNGIECDGYVFMDSGLENVRLPSTLKRLEAGTFSWCNYLETIEIPRGVEYIGKKCFWYG